MKMAVEKKKASKAANHRKSGGFSAAFDWFGETKLELGRITWTSPSDLQVYTRAVVVAMFVFGMALYVSDLVLESSLWGLGLLFQTLGG